MSDKNISEKQEAKDNEDNSSPDVHIINDDSSASETTTDESSLQLKKELDLAKNDYLYLKAEFDNFRKNTIKERADLYKFGSERIIVELLDVIDNFDRALSAEITAENYSSFKQGIEMTSQELRGVLSNFGVSELDPLGLPFDPMAHEALSSEATNEVKPGFVCRVFKKAYKLHDKIIRPAQVVVARENENENEEDGNTKK